MNFLMMITLAPFVIFSSLSYANEDGKAIDAKKTKTQNETSMPTTESAAPNPAETAELSNASERSGEAYNCTLGELSRKIRVVYEDQNNPVPCRVEYNKEAEGAGISSLWRAQNSAGFCEERLIYFVSEKLKANGWTCEKTAG